MQKYMLLLLTTLSFCSLSQDSEFARQWKALKPYNDFTFLELDNGTNVAIVQNERLRNSGVSIRINAGAEQDPEISNGLAHFLEHMVFLGSEQFPESDNLKGYVEKAGGLAQAITSLDETEYFFEVPNRYLHQVLTRAGAALREPLLSPAFIASELEVLDAEWQRNQRTLPYTLSRIMVHNLPDGHPSKRFLIGNRASLQRQGQVELARQLREFWSRHYVGQHINIAITTSHPVSDTAEWVTKAFADLSFGKARPETEQNRSPVSRQAICQQLSTHHAVSMLSLSFPLSQSVPLENSKLMRFVQHFLLNAEQGGLQHDLLSKGLISQLFATVHAEAGSLPARLSFTFHLTPQGANATKGIVSRTLAYMQFLAGAVNEQTLAQIPAIKHLPALGIHDSALGLSRKLSKRMTLFAGKDLFRRFVIDDDIQAWRNMLSDVELDNLHMVCVNCEATDKGSPIEYAQGKLRTTACPVDDKVVKPATDSGYVLPGSAPKKAADDTYQYNDKYSSPLQIRRKQSHGVFLQHSDNAYGTEVAIKVYPAFSSLAGQDWQHLQVLRLWFNQQALISASLAFSSTPFKRSWVANDGVLNIRIFTSTAKTEDNLQQALDQLALFTSAPISKESYNHWYQQWLRSSNYHSNIPLTVFSFLPLAIRDTLPQSPIDMQIQPPNYQSFSQWRKTLARAVELQTFIYAPISESRALAFADKLEQRLQFTAKENPPTDKPAQENARYQIDSPSNGSGYLRFFKAAKNDTRSQVLLELIALASNQDFYRELRSEGKSGYVTALEYTVVDGHPVLLYMLESFNHQLQQLSDKIDAFDVQQLSRLKAMQTREFRLLKDRWQENQRFSHGAGLSMWEKGQTDFDQSDQQSEVLRKLTANELALFYQQQIVQGQLPMTEIVLGK